jgi:hypothetical protein
MFSAWTEAMRMSGLPPKESFQMPENELKRTGKLKFLDRSGV